MREPSESWYQKEATKTVHKVDLIFIVCTLYNAPIFSLFFFHSPLAFTFIFAEKEILQHIFCFKFDLYDTLNFFSKCLVAVCTQVIVICALYYTHTHACMYV